MGRVPTVTTGTPISSTTFGNPLITDYLSQTDTTAQTIASPITFGKTRFAPKYTVYADGSYYRVMKEDGSMSLPSTDSFSTAVNDEAFAGLTAGRLTAGYPETVLLKGNLTLDGKILLPSYVNFVIDGKITLATNVNDHMIDTVPDLDGNTHTDGVTICGGGILDCNLVNQAGAGPYHGIHFVNGTANNMNNYVRNLQVKNVKGSAVFLEKCAEMHMKNIRLYNALKGLNLYIVWDSWFDEVNANYITDENLLMMTCGMNDLSKLYLGGTSGADGQLWMGYCTFNLFKNIRIDHPSKHGLFLVGQNANRTTNNSFENLSITECTGAANTYDSIYLEDYCEYNDFAFNIKGIRSAGNTWRYGVNEVANSDYNVFYAKSVQNCATANSLITGAHSKFNVGWTP